MLPSSLLMQSNPYAPPTSSEATTPPVWSDSTVAHLYDRDGAVELALGATFPDICGRCGATHDLLRRRLPLVARQNWHYFALGVGVLLFYVVDSGVARGYMSVCLCPSCYKRYSHANMAAWLVAIPLAFWSVCFASLRSFEKLDVPVWWILFTLMCTIVSVVVVGFALHRFVPPRKFKLFQVKVGPWGRVMRVGGVHPRAMEALMAAEAARYAPSPQAGFAPSWQPGQG